MLAVFATLALAMSPFAQAPHLPEEWKFDVVHLKTGRKVQGLLVREGTSVVILLPIQQNPGEPTRPSPEPATYSWSAIDRLDKLEPKDREILLARLAALKSSGDELRMKSLKLTPARRESFGISGLSFSSPHFVLVSDAGEELVRQIAVRLEDIYNAFARFLPSRQPGARPTTIVIFRSLAEYHEALRGQGKNILNPAFFDAGSNQILAACDLPRLRLEREQKRRECQELSNRLLTQEAEWRKLYKDRIPADYLQKLANDRHGIEQTELKNDAKLRKARERFSQILYHESFHAYLAGFVYPPAEALVPRWLNEGLAQIFEGAILEAGELRVGHADQERLGNVKTALRKGEFVSLTDLLRSGSEQFVVAHAADRQVSDQYYLASWALSFYLTFERKKLGTAEMDRYVRTLKHPGADHLEAFSQLAEQPLPEFERGWHEYLRRLRSNGKRQ